MKKVVIKLLIFVVIVFVFDRLIGSCLSYLFFRTYEGDFGGRINLALKSAPDVLILGSSRAEHHYIPEIIAKRTGLTTFNAGMDGQSIFYHYGIQQLVCKKHTPKLIVLEFRPDDLYLGDDALERLSLLLPFRNNVEINEILKYRSPYESLKYCSKIYPFNSKVLGILRFTFNKNAEGSSLRNGYTPLFGQITDEMIKASRNKLVNKAKKINDFDSLKLVILKKMIQFANDKAIRLLLVESPSWYPDYFKKNLLQREIEWSTAKNNVKSFKINLFQVENEVVLFRERELFKDFTHLNDTGSKKFSELVSLQINKLLKKGINGNN